MFNPEISSQLARERRERYHTDAGRHRLARPTRRADIRARLTGRTDETQ